MLQIYHLKRVLQIWPPISTFPCFLFVSHVVSYWWWTSYFLFHHQLFDASSLTLNFSLSLQICLPLHQTFPSMNKDTTDRHSFLLLQPLRSLHIQCQHWYGSWLTLVDWRPTCQLSSRPMLPRCHRSQWAYWIEPLQCPILKYRKHSINKSCGDTHVRYQGVRDKIACNIICISIRAFVTEPLFCVMTRRSKQLIVSGMMLSWLRLAGQSVSHWLIESNYHWLPTRSDVSE